MLDKTQSLEYANCLKDAIKENGLLLASDEEELNADLAAIEKCINSHQPRYDIVFSLHIFMPIMKLH